MQVDYIVDYMKKIFAQTVNIYKTTSDSKDADGNYIPHYVESITDEQLLMALDISIKNIALSTISLNLLETTGSDATVLRRISTEEFIRVPKTPKAGSKLDIDDSLAFAVMYKALAFLYSGYSSYGSDADGIVASQNDSMRDYMMSREVLPVTQKTVYFRYSSDGKSWHDNFVDGDIYISIRQGDGVWSDAIKFVGSDGAKGNGGASTFLDLSDTPTSFTADKWIKVNSAGDALIETDAPKATVTLEGMQGADGVSGDLALDMRQGKGNTVASYLVLNGDLTLDFTQTDGVYDLDAGVIYTIEIVPSGYNCTLKFDAKGNKTIDKSSYANYIQILYDGLDIYILNNIAF